jgi:K+-sensing histidine kinase KdpD
LQYAVAVLSVAAALALALLTRGFDLQIPLMLMAIAVAVWYGTRWSGFLAIVLAVAGLDYFFLPPLYRFEIGLVHLPQVLVFTSFAVVIS